MIYKKRLAILSLILLFSCESNSPITIDKFAGDWQLMSLKRKEFVEDSVVQKSQTTIHFKDSLVSIRTPHYFGKDVKYRKWNFKDSILSLPYSADIMG